MYAFREKKSVAPQRLFHTKVEGEYKYTLTPENGFLNAYRTLHDKGVRILKKWYVKLPGGFGFELEADDPGAQLVKAGYTSFALEEILPPPPVQMPETSPYHKLTMSVAEAAQELGICSRIVYDLVHRADFPAIRIGRRVRISREGLAEWVRKQAEAG